MTLTAIDPVCGRVPPDQVNAPQPYEQTFYRFLDAQGRRYRIEPWKLLHEPYRPRPNLVGMTPDILLHPQVDGYEVYLELTSGDRHKHAKMLSKKVRRKNRHQSRSGEEFVPIPEYLRYKRARIAETYRCHPEVVVILLDCRTQEAIYVRPALLDELIAAEVAVRRRAIAA